MNNDADTGNTGIATLRCGFRRGEMQMEDEAQNDGMRFVTRCDEIAVWGCHAARV